MSRKLVLHPVTGKYVLCEIQGSIATIVDDNPVLPTTECQPVPTHDARSVSVPQFSETSSQVINTGQPNPGTVPIAPDYVQTLNILQFSINTAWPPAAVSAPPRDDEVYRPAVISINN